MAKPVPFKLPKTLAQCADLLYTTRQERLTLDHEAKGFKEREGLLRDHLIDELPKSQAAGITGRVARATITTKTVPSLKDFEALCRWVLKESARHAKRKDGLELEPFSVFTRALSAEAVAERWDLGLVVDGVEPFTVVSVSLNKV